eukprot:8846714-Ditylum_brightwellii.AAC.1
MATIAAFLQSIDLIQQQHIVNDWNGKLMFRVDPGGFSGVAELDICQFFRKDCKLGISKLYADKLKYPLPLPGLKMLPSSDPTWKNLSHDIQYASHASGLPIMYKPPKKRKKGDSYCKESLVNSEKAGCREDGKSKSKKTMTRMSLPNGQCCQLKVVVKWDNKGFYID